MAYTKLFIMAFAVMAISTGLVASNAHAQSMLAETEIIEDCGASIVENSLIFTVGGGGLVPLAISDEELLNFVNNGNVPADLEVEGSTWDEVAPGTDTNVMNVGVTTFGGSGFAYPGTAVGPVGTPATIQTIAAQSSIEVAWIIQAILNFAFAGFLEQQLDFIVTCQFSPI